MPVSHQPDMADADGATLAMYLGWLRRRWWILTLFAVFGAIAALVVTQIQPRAYESTTSLLVRQIGVDANANPNAKVNLDTEAQVVRSLVVAERARTNMGSSVPADELVKWVTVTVPPNSQVLQIAFEANSPQLAQSGSHAFAQAYLDLKRDDATRRLENETAALKQQVAEVQRQLGVVTGRIAAAPANSVARERAEADRSVLTNQLTTLNTRLSPLLAASLDPGEIISDARLPTSPSSPNRTLNLASGLGAGLLFAIVLALVLDRLDTRVRRGRDIAERLGLPMLLELPDRVQSLSLLPPTHRISRELGRLRNVLLTTVPEPRVTGNGRQILLTDASAGPAAGYVAGNLAAAYARTGQQVVIMTTKPDSPLTAMLGGVTPRYGLADVLRRDVSALKALTPVPGLSQLRVLLPGKLDADEELPVAAMLEVLGDLAARFEHVIVETASPTHAVEAQALASHVDAVIVVAETGRTRSGEIAAALRQFDQVDAPVLGAVLAPRMPSVAKAKPGAASKAPNARADEVTTQVLSKSAAAKNRKAMLVLPQPGEPTVVLPRVKDTERAEPVVVAGNGNGNGNGHSSAHKPVAEKNGKSTANGSTPTEAGPARLRVALDSGEDLG
jgi:polysaccharide biosynthesis transport protein